MPIWQPTDSGVYWPFQPATQCLLQWQSTNLLRLFRRNGCLLTIDDAPQVIPAAGVDLTPAGLAAQTSYYIYAYMNAGVMTLEASVTGYTADARNGIAIKSGDATRTLIGYIYTWDGPTFGWDATHRLVANYYNTEMQAASAAFTNIANGSNTPVALGPKLYLVTFQKILVHLNGYVNNNTAGQYGLSDVYVNGSGGGNTTVSSSTAASAYGDIAITAPFAVGVGKYEIQTMAWVSGGLGYWNGTIHATWQA